MGDFTATGGKIPSKNLPLLVYVEVGEPAHWIWALMP
ncbi:hypothetical protein EYZ11_012674 [Aspergillus tanneri]|uniref:Uncharacterized protein n=1 Tax=Aspergillus tanneri TaxID=1220188 RepID=A0A4S3J1S0_9EURO|nr:hypothetical protein EYZ11_012674 [Aspergillus tanneri]